MPSLGEYANAFLLECDTLIARNISGNLLNKDLSINSLELNEKWKIYLDDSSNFILKNEIIDVVSLSGNAITGNITFKGQETDFENYDDASFGNVDISGVLNLQNGLLTIDNSYGLQYQVLMSNGENNSVFWNTLPEGVEYFAGTDMSLVGTTFNNTAPDQVVTLTEGSNITITGIYPNFTITTDLNNYVDASFGNVDISGNLDISNGVINFFASDEVLIGANTGILQRLEDLSNNLLISYNDASFNNVELSGNLYINGVSGVSGEVLRSQGSTSSPIWASIGVTDVSNNNSTYNSLGSIDLSNNTLIYNRPDIQTYFAGIQVNNNFSNASRNSLSFTNQIQSGITTSSSGFTSTKLGWYNLTYNFTTNASQVFGYSFIWIVKSGTDYFRSAVRDQGSPYEFEANHGGGMLIFLLIGDTITFSTQADSGSYNINGFASLIKM